MRAALSAKRTRVIPTGATPRLFDQSHGLLGRDGLGQGLDAEQGIFRHGYAALEIGHAEGPVAQAHDDGPGDAIGLDPGRCRFRKAGCQRGCAVLRHYGICIQNEHSHHLEGCVAESGKRGHPADPRPIMRPRAMVSPTATYH